MAEPNLDELVKENKIPNQPEVLDAIKADKTGAVLERVQARHADFLQRSSPPTDAGALLPGAPPPLSVTKVLQPAAPPPPQNAVPKTPSQDEVLTKLIGEDKIPNSPPVLDAIKSGKVTLEQVQAKHSAWRANNPIVSLDSSGKVNAPEVMKATAVEPQTVTKMASDSMKSLTAPPKLLMTMLPKSFGFDPNQGITHDGQPLTPDKIVPALTEEWEKSAKFRAGAMLSGATFGLVDNPAENPGGGLEGAAGVICNLVGGIPTGIGLGKVFSFLGPFAKLENVSNKLGVTGKALKEARVAVEASQGSGEAWLKLGTELWKNRALKTGVDVARVGAESAITGFGIGTGHALLEGKDTVDALSDGLAESALWTAFGVALLPVAGVAGKAFGRRQAVRQEAVTRGVAAMDQTKALAGQADEFLPGIKARFAPDVAGPISPREAIIKDGLERLKITEPLIGAKAAILAHPELLLEVHQGRMENVSKGLFGPGGAFEKLPTENPRLSLLLSTGKYSEAIDAAQTALTDAVTKNPAVTEFAMAPFTQNADTLHGVYAERILNTVKNPERYPNLKANLLNYLGDQSAENALLLKQNAPRGFVQKVAKQEFYDVRLKPAEVDQVVGKIWEKSLAALSNKEPAALGSLAMGTHKDTDAVLRTAITFNKELNRSFMQAFQQNPYGFGENFIKVQPDLMQPVSRSIDYQRIAQERDISLGKRRDLSGVLTELKDQIRASTDPAETQKLQAVFQATKDKFSVVTGVLTQQNAQMRAIEAEIASLPKEKAAMVDDYISKMYLPKRSGESFDSAISKRMETGAQVRPMQRMLASEDVSNTEKLAIMSDIRELRMRGKPRIQGSSDYIAKFGAQENPYFIKADSELADSMNAFVTAGTDFKRSTNSTYSFPFVVNLENPRRRAQRELGPNNVIEKVITKIKDADFFIANKMKFYDDQINGLGIKARSKESAILQRIGEGRLAKTDPEFLALPAASQEKINAALPKVRAYYDTMIDSINDVMASNNLPMINKRDDYLLHFGEEMDGLPAKIARLLNGDSSDVASFGGKSPEMFWKSKTKLDPNRTFFGSEKARKGGEFVDDAITGMQLYTKPALERIYYADLVRELDTARHFAPDQIGQFLQNIKEDYLLKVPNVLDKMTSGGLKGTMNTLRTKLGKGAILFNVNTALQQLLSIPQNFAMSPQDGFKALNRMWSKEGYEISAMSKSLAKRDATMMDIDKDARALSDIFTAQTGIGSESLQRISATKEAASQYWEKIGGYAMQHFDKVAARHAYMTGFYKARSMGATVEQSAQFGDRWLEMVQNDMSRVSQPAFYQSMIGRSFGQFSSFMTNFAATIMNDMPTIARTEGGARAVSMIIKSMAGMTIANESARAVGMPAPFDLDTFMPFLGSYRFGAPGLGSILPNAMLAVSGNADEQQKAKKALTRTGAALAITGGGQAYKTFDAFYDADLKYRSTPSSSGRFRDAIFGRGRNVVEKQRTAELKKGFVGRTKAKLSAKIKKKVFEK